MHLITTHQNSDFDAVASLLAAHRLYPQAQPVLPYTLNRNVQAFVTLYGRPFPFVRANQLENRPITQLTLVDTQQRPPLKNLSAETHIHIIDHHDPPDTELPNVTLSLTDTGATITYLIEQLREQGLTVSTIEATLYLLAIYEDTGSLTYGSTTARDLQAAAWLLAEGQGELDLVREYLNYSMTPAQIALYNQLMNNQESSLIHGQTVVIATASIDHYVTEISTIAHQLRDLYNPAALLLLVEMFNHRPEKRVIQLVARATSEAVDVGQLADQLGGGGHQRAAAASIKETSLSEVKHAVTTRLPQVVQPVISVGDIMSKGVHTLTPSQTIHDALGMIDRYGHEGFPVVTDDGRIVGILSRREVDKARRHQLEGAPINQFMLKGEFFVTPTDSLETVREQMVAHRIGQLPVVDESTKQLIGIVTRTDLLHLRQLSDKIGPSRLNLTTPLQQRLSAPLFELLHQAGRLASEQGDNLYIVGGFVRDLLLMMRQNSTDEQSKASPRFDLDLVVEGQAIPLAHALQKEHGGRVHSHDRFGTAKWLLPEPIPFDTAGQATLSALDFVTARTEFYGHPSALPEVEPSSIRHDLHRRDFTINTLALQLNSHHFGDLLDFYNGQTDLEAGLIRVLHSLSFIEDPTRMLRAARLLARLDFALEERTAELFMNAHDTLKQVSPERIRHELDLIFNEREPTKAVQQLAALHILTTIHPALVVDDGLLARLANAQTTLTDSPWPQTSMTPLHYLGLLLFRLTESDLQTVVSSCLNLPQAEQKTLQQAQAIGQQLGTLASMESASQLYQLLHETTVEARQIVWLGVDGVQVQQRLAWFETALKSVKPLIDGAYLQREFQLQPSPLFGTILRRLREARLDGEVTTLADERHLVMEMLQTVGDSV